MLRIMCKSKIHRARITKTELHYQGSIGVDKKLLEASNIYPNEIVQVLNLNNGSRLETHVIEEKENSGEIILYGPAARMGQSGDIVIIVSQALVEAKEVPHTKQRGASSLTRVPQVGHIFVRLVFGFSVVITSRDYTSLQTFSRLIFVHGLNQILG